MKKQKLEIKWSKREQDFVVKYPNKSDGGYFLHRIIGIFGKREVIHKSIDLSESDTLIEVVGDYKVFTHDLIKELENRGYDTKTLKVSIQKK